MFHHLSLRAAAILSALSSLLPFLALAQGDGASDTFDVFVTPTNYQVVAAGSNFDIIWTPSPPAGSVTIRLMQGPTELTQDFGPTIASGIDSAKGKYTWSIPSSYGDYPTYGLELQLDSDPTIFQYSYPFIISKVGNPASAYSSTAPAPPSTAVATSAGVFVVTPSSTPSSLKPGTTSQAATSSRNNPNSPSGVASYATKPEATSPTSASSSGSAHSSTESSPTSNPTVSTSMPTNSSQTSSPTSPASILNSTSTSAPSTDLSTAAKVGIAIGAFLALCIIALLAYIAFLIRRRNNNTHKISTTLDSIEDEPKHNIYELGGEGLVAEMEAGKREKKPKELAIRDKSGEKSGDKFRRDDVPPDFPNGAKFRRDEVNYWRRGGRGRLDDLAELA